MKMVHNNFKMLIQFYFTPFQVFMPSFKTFVAFICFQLQTNKLNCSSENRRIFKWESTWAINYLFVYLVFLVLHTNVLFFIQSSKVTHTVAAEGKMISSKVAKKNWYLPLNLERLYLRKYNLSPVIKLAISTISLSVFTYLISIYCILTNTTLDLNNDI